jgi:small subunit ribosomal protein S1
MPDPWSTVTERYAVGSRVRGKVVSLADYGAFIEIEQGVEGLLHVSEMSWTKRVTHPSKLLSVGEEVEVIIVEIDPHHRRISLGLKQISPILGKWSEQATGWQPYSRQDQEYH